MESLERRALVMLVVVGLLVVRATVLYPAGVTWLIAVYIFGLACLTAASVLLVVAIAPSTYIGHWDSERQRILFYAFALLVSDVVVTAMIFAYGAYTQNAQALGG